MPGRRPAQPRGGYGSPGDTGSFAEPAEPSLTGHILAQGRPDTEVRGTRTTKVMIAMLVVLTVLVIGGLAAAIFAGDQVGSMFNSFFRSGGTG